MKVKKTESVGGVVLNRNGEVLVVNQDGASWSLPKGHIEQGENEEATARREIHEESGITDITIVKKLGKYNRYRLDENGNEDKSEQKTIHIYLMRTNEMGLKPMDKANPEARWVDKNKVANLLTHKKDKAFYLSIVNQLDT